MRVGFLLFLLCKATKSKDFFETLHVYIFLRLTFLIIIFMLVAGEGIVCRFPNQNDTTKRTNIQNQPTMCW